MSAAASAADVTKTSTKNDPGSVASRQWLIAVTAALAAILETSRLAGGGTRAAKAHRRCLARKGGGHLFEIFSEEEQGKAQALFGIVAIAGPASDPCLAATSSRIWIGVGSSSSIFRMEWSPFSWPRASCRRTRPLRPRIAKWTGRTCQPPRASTISPVSSGDPSGLRGRRPSSPEGRRFIRPCAGKRFTRPIRWQSLASTGRRTRGGENPSLVAAHPPARTPEKGSCGRRRALSATNEASAKVPGSAS